MQVRDEDGALTTVRYEAVNAMLLNEFLEEQGQMQELKADRRPAAEANPSTDRRTAKGDY
jgi:hypothetical protein